jgi:MinD-like ATPase involved in chromosome partitioning or flagellar assembly
MSGLICVTGSKGSPGATTLAFALALTREAALGRGLLIDADPDGGDLAAILGVGASPGLMTLAAASRHRFDPSEIDRHLRPLSPSIDLMPGPSSPEQATAALATLGEPFAGVLAVSAVLADLGRWRPSSPATELARASSATVLVIQPTVEGVAHARSVFADLATHCRRVVVATRGERPYGPDEVAAAIGCAPPIVLPDDRRGVALLTAGIDLRRLRRCPLARAARDLHGMLEPTAPVVDQHAMSA